MQKPLFLAVIFTSSICLNADAPSGVQWVKTMGGSGTNTVVKAAADAQGNFYIVGNTSSLDFPVTSAVQRAAGGSTLVRIDTATGASDKLYPSGLSTIASIAADPTNPQTLYATTANNLLWRSTDSGSTWNTVFQFPSTVTVRFVAVDPSNSKNIYIGTNPQGPMKSTDGGLTWSSINNGITPGRGGPSGVYHIWVDPKYPQVIFASATSGLWRSPDAGATWTLVVGSIYIDNMLVFDPFNAGAIYLAGSGGIGGISKSMDDGQTLTPISQLPDLSQPSAMIADPLHAGVLFAASSSGLYQSVDSGLTWTRKSNAPTSFLAADPSTPALYANNSVYGIVKSTDSFHTSVPLGLPEPSLLQMLVAGTNVFLIAQPSTDIFAVKLDPNGNMVYSTYFGGSGNDSAVDMAVSPDGSVYVTGSTTSGDFPVTAGAYASALSGLLSNFVFKLNPGGSLGWATYFGPPRTIVDAIAVDSAGNPYIGGSSEGSLPTTPGVYQTQFQIGSGCMSFFLCFPPTSAFVTKFNAKGTGLVYSTYVPTDDYKNVVQAARSMAIDSSGNTYFSGGENLILLNATGSAVLASAGQSGMNVNTLTLDAGSNLYATGTWSNAVFPATSGAFQPAPQPAIPNLPTQFGAGGGSDAFVMKWDSRLSQILAATLLGGESSDRGESLALDSSGNVIISGFTDSKAFPTRAPFQTSFSPRTGFVSILDSSLSHLLFSTYLGDDRAFDARAAVPDPSGNILIAGSTLIDPQNGLLGGDPGGSFTVPGIVVANKITMPAASSLRLDSVVNFASHLATPIAPGEAIAAIGSGFGSDVQLVVDGVPLAGSTLNGVMPDSSKTSGAYQIQVSSGGSLSNSVLIPAAPAYPGIFSVSGSGYGQGYILNSDGTMNSPASPASPGAPITILATGVGSYTLSGGYAVLAQPPAVFIDGFYANGIASVLTPVAGLPGNVYQISVYVPDPAKLVAQNPNLLNFKMPPQVAVKLVVGTVNPFNPDNSSLISQPGLVLSVKQ